MVGEDGERGRHRPCRRGPACARSGIQRRSDPGVSIGRLCLTNRLLPGETPLRSASRMMPSASSDGRRLCVIGIDLAWGSRARTGVAVAGPVAGELLLVESVISDAELDAAAGTPCSDGPCVVGLDAPLIVTNPTGRRPCEALLSKAFAAQHAGCYPSNTGLAAFADGGRAAAFARRHNLAVDATVPVTTGQRRALEVYPHSTTVALFELPRVLAYKVRPHRSLESRRAELLRLLDLLATLARPHRWTGGLPTPARPHRPAGRTSRSGPGGDAPQRHSAARRTRSTPSSAPTPRCCSCTVSPTSSATPTPAPS